MIQNTIPCHLVSHAVPCENHTVAGHLFKYTFCDNQTLLKKIAIVVFNILTFCIPLAIYHVFACYFPKQFHGKTPLIDLQARAIYSVQQDRPPQAICEEAIQFARQKLIEHPEITAEPIAGPAHRQPIHQEINRLCALSRHIYFPAFKNAIIANREDPWSRQAVVEAADNLMKISYAISTLTLDDLPAFWHTMTAMGERLTYERILSNQTFYQYRTFYGCTNAYHFLRGGITAKLFDQEYQIEYPQEEVSESYTRLFYTNGTIQNSWNILYNNYCDRIRRTVNIEVLRREDQRHVHWTQKDTSPATFRRVPDTQPT